MWPIDQDALPHQSILAVNWLSPQLQSLGFKLKLQQLMLLGLEVLTVAHSKNTWCLPFQASVLKITGVYTTRIVAVFAWVLSLQCFKMFSGPVYALLHCFRRAGLWAWTPGRWGHIPLYWKNKFLAKSQYIEALSTFLATPTVQQCHSWVCHHSTPMSEDRASPNNHKQIQNSTRHNQGMYF